MSNAVRTGDGHGRLGNFLSGLAVAVGCLLFLGGFAWGAVQYQPYTVPTTSMMPSIAAGDRVLAQRIDGDEARRGDVVVFTDKVWGDVPMVKRVVGIGGDKVTCCDKQGRLQVNGKPIAEPYLEDPTRASASDFTTTVPKGQLFLLGDERTNSMDSRVHLTDGDHGSVPRSAVNARVDTIAWPMNGFKTMQRPSAFEALPGGVSDPGPIRLLVFSAVAGVVLILAGAAYGPVARLVGRKRSPAGAR